MSQLMEGTLVKRGARLAAAILAFFIVGAFAFPASGTLLNLNLTREPDIFSVGITVTYEQGIFTADGFSWMLNNTPIGGTFSIAASVDPAGVFSSGVLSITDARNVPLLQGSLAALGFDGYSGVMNFLFTDLTGSLSSLYGDSAGVTLDATGMGGRAFADSFSNQGFSVSDTLMAVPEPSALYLQLLGIGSLFCLIRRRLPIRAAGSSSQSSTRP